MTREHLVEDCVAVAEDLGMIAPPQSASPMLTRDGQPLRWRVVESARACDGGCVRLSSRVLEIKRPVYVTRCDDCGTIWETRPHFPPGLEIVRGKRG